MIIKTPNFFSRTKLNYEHKNKPFVNAHFFETLDKKSSITDMIFLFQAQITTLTHFHNRTQS